MTRNNFMKFFSIVFAFFLFLIPTTAKTADLLESCSPAICWGDLQCPGFQMFGQSLKKEKICLPEKTYKPCGASGDCTTTLKGSVCVVGNTVDKTTQSVAFCLKETRFPPGDKGDAIFNKCLTSKNCGKNEQCVRITRYDKELGGFSEFVQNNNCVPINELPASLVLQDTTGSCGQNQECGTDETCIENTYVDIEAKKAYIPLSGIMTFKSPVCYKTKYLNGACPEYGKSCVVPNGGTNGYCMYALEGGKSALKCVDATYLPNGPKSPSNYACTSDSQCTGAAAEYKYCLTNPVTKQGQCFAQKNIYTDMSKLSAQVCLDGKPCACPLVGKEGCESTGKESICAAYSYKGTAVCIDYAGGGAALSSGKGEASTEPSHLPKPDVAQQTYEMYAPKLQIDIPNLTFTDKITAEDGPGGIKRFSIPYLAAYIQAIYKYAIGLGVLIAVVMLTYAGFRWMSSFGNTKAVSEAKTMVGNSMLGLLLVFSAYTILYVINPELPKFKALNILAPEQEVFENYDTGQPIPTQTQAEADNTTFQGGPFTPTNSKSAVIEQLIGPLPSNFEPCSPEAANDTATKLTKIGVCVADLNCANTASAFMNYIKCTSIKEDNARYLVALLEQSGWTTIFLTPENVKTIPVGVLWKPKGHVGIALGGNYGQFDSGNMMDNMDIVNKNSGASCIKKKGEGIVDAAGCAKCAVAPSFGVPKTGLDAQGWAKKPKVTLSPSYAKWVLVVVPQKYAQYTGPRGPCTVAGIKMKNGISPALCDALTKTWPKVY